MNLKKHALLVQEYFLLKFVKSVSVARQAGLFFVTELYQVSR